MTDRKIGASSGGRDDRGRFVRGNKGKPKGSRHKATVLAQALLEGGIQDAVQTILAAVRKGDVMAAKVVIDKLVPAVKERPVTLALPDVTDAAGVAEAQDAIVRAVAAGELLPGEGSTLAGILEARRRAIETMDLESRVAALEKER
jgi:hypothetical protein